MDPHENWVFNLVWINATAVVVITGSAAVEGASELLVGELFLSSVLFLDLFGLGLVRVSAKHGCFTRVDSLEDVEHVAQSDDAHLLAQCVLELLLVDQHGLEEWRDVLVIGEVFLLEVELDVLLNRLIGQHHSDLPLASELVHDTLYDVDAKCLGALVAETHVEEHHLDLVELVDLVSGVLQLVFIVRGSLNLLLVSFQSLGTHLG